MHERFMESSREDCGKRDSIIEKREAAIFAHIKMASSQEEHTQGGVLR